ncbi:MAG: hypothetical protein NC313_12740 [Butyrivibrio sp.]|nr:hypothetical protein [Butyrivibrio sp.]
MIIELSKKIEFKYCNPFTIEHSAEEKCNIYNCWNEYTKSKNSEDCFDGDIFLVTDIYSDKESVVIEIGKGKYSELIYSKQTGKLHTNSLFVASYIVTSDNYLGFVMDKGERVNTIGGMADISDFINGVFKPELCLAREFNEELGVDLYNKSIFFSVSAKYLKIANEDEQKLPLYPIGILYEVCTTYTKADLQEKLQNSKGLVKEKNIVPVFYAKKDCIKLEQHTNKVSYILELFNCILKE